jgi:hypothetical protein
MKCCRLLSLVACLIVLTSAPAWGWMFSGHMLTGAIAYDTLKNQNPKALAAVVAILKQHPLYDKMWAKKLDKVAPDDRDQALFMLAARWPDDIRGNSDYDHPNWHYIDYPFKPVGQPDSVQTADPPDPNIETAFRTNVDIIKGDTSDAEKAVALCWIFHLMGDSHQPLHAVSLFTTDYPGPAGDQGGNKSFIRAKTDGEPLKLHRFWDSLISTTEDTRDIRKLAIELRSKYPQEKLDPQPTHVSASDFANWIQESAQFARNDVYQNGQLATSPEKETAPVLPDEYIQHAKALGEERVAQAGYRTADVLAQLFQ